MILVFGQLIIRTKDVPWPREQSRTARIMLLCMLEKLDILGPKIGVATYPQPPKGTSVGDIAKYFFLGLILSWSIAILSRNHVSQKSYWTLP